MQKSKIFLCSVWKMLYLCTRIQQFEVKVIPNAGHSMAWENPQGLSDVIYQSIVGR